MTARIRMTEPADHRLILTAIVGGYAGECACGRWWMRLLAGEDQKQRRMLCAEHRAHVRHAQRKEGA